MWMDFKMSSASLPDHNLKNGSLYVWNLDQPLLRKRSTKHCIEHRGTTGQDVPMTFHFLPVGTRQERDVTQYAVVKNVGIG